MYQADLQNNVSWLFGPWEHDLYLIWFPRVLMGSPDCDKQSCETMSPDRLDRLLVPVYALQCFAPSLWAQIRRATSQYQYGGEQCLLLYLALCCALVTVILWCPDSAANKTTVGTFLGYQYSAWERCSGLCFQSCHFVKHSQGQQKIAYICFTKMLHFYQLKLAFTNFLQTIIVFLYHSCFLQAPGSNFPI